jgi:phage baseplate assembly protein W
MRGTNRTDGAPLSGRDHLAQSIAVILLTPVGSRVLRRDFGSRIFSLVDSPGTETGALRLIAASADAVTRWEPRVRFDGATVTPGADGAATIAIDWTDLESGQPGATEVTL